jgi:hypothetical protein
MDGFALALTPPVHSVKHPGRGNGYMGGGWIGKLGKASVGQGPLCTFILSSRLFCLGLLRVRVCVATAAAAAAAAVATLTTYLT